MANQNSRINIQVGYTVDKSGLEQMQSMFQQIVNKAKEPGNEMKTGLQAAGKTAMELDKILDKTFNTNLGTLNVAKFNQELSKSGLTIKQIKSDLIQEGNQGAAAYNKLAQSVLNTNRQLVQTNKLLDSMADTFTKTVKWGIASSVFNNISNSIQKAFTFTKQLDTSLNDIRIVTDKSAESMEKFAQQANQAAKGMGASTLDYTNAALIYYQQGLSDSEVAARAETTIKAANVTGQKGEEVSEQLTAVWNGYKVTAEETELYVDKLAAVAATTAADLEELSTGMSKVASAANAMGVDFDDLNAQLATIVSVTRQAPESVGTALKTIYARLGDLKVDGVDEFGVKLGEVSSQLQTMGIDILDVNGDMRNMTDVMTEVAEKWETWTDAQRQAAAVAMAGKRQYNNLIALFDNWDMYSKALETSADAMGTLQHQQDIYMESTEAKIQKLRTTMQGLYDDLIDTDEINTGIELLTDFAQVFDNLVSSFGGGLKTVAGFGAILSSVFNKQIIKSINEANQRQQIFKNNLELAKLSQQVRAEGAAEMSPNAAAYLKANEESTKAQLHYANELYKVRHGITEEQAEEFIEKQKQLGQLQKESSILDIKTQKLADNLKEQQAFGKATDEVVEKILKGENADSLIGKELKNQQQTLKENINYVEKYQESLQKTRSQNTFSQPERVSDQLHIDAREVTTRLKKSKVYNKLSNEDQQRLKLAQTINVETEEYKNIIQDVEKAIKAALKLLKEETNELDKQDQIIQQQKESLENLQGERYEANQNTQNVKNDLDNIIKIGEEGEKVAQTVSSVTSTLGGIAMAWSSISSIASTWSDETLSFGEKLTQSIMALSMAIPMAISSLKNLNETFILTKGVEDALTFSTDLNTLALEANDKMNKARELQMEFNLTLAQTGIEQTTLLTQKQILENEAEEINAHIKRLRNIESNKSIIALFKENAAIKAGTISVDENTAATIRNAAVRASALIGIMAAIAAIAIIVKLIEKWHEAQVKEAKATLEAAKNTQEQIKANQELLKSYQDLYTKYNETGEGKAELLESTFKLVDAYDIENGRILALTDQYDILNAKIKEKIQNELTDQKVSAQSGAVGAAKLVAEAASKGTGSTFGAGAGNYQTNLTALQGLTSYGKEDEKLVGPLEELQTRFAHVKIDYTTDPQEMMDYIDLIDKSIKYISALPEEQRKTYKVIYDQLIEEQGQLAEASGDLKEQLDLLYSANIKEQFLDFDFEKTSLSELSNKIDEVKNNLESTIPENQIDEFVDNYLNSIDIIGADLEKINIAKQFSNQTEEGLKEVLNQIDNFNNEQLAYLSLHLNTAVLNGDLNQWLKDNENIINAYAAVGTAEDFKTLIKGYNKDTGFTQEQQENIYNENSDMGQYMQVDQSTFSVMDQSQQLSVVTEAWIDNTKAVVENKDTIVASLEEEITALEKEGKAVDNNGKTISDRGRDSLEAVKKLVDANEEYKGRTAEVQKAIIDLSEKGYDNLSTSQKALIDTLSEGDDLLKNRLSKYGKQIKASQEYDNALNGLESELERVNNATVNYDEFLQQLTADQEHHNTLMDNIQSAYQSLISIVDSYNETGAFTLDQVQKLMTMDDAYLATLQFENGQLVLNEESFRNLTIAKINDMEETAIKTAQTELEALAEEDAGNAAVSAGKNIEWAATKVREGAAAAYEGAAAWDTYAASMRAAAGVSGAAYDAKAKEITDALQVKLQSAEKLKNELNKGGGAMRTAMGAGSKSSGGGGGSSSKEKEKKEFNDEIDRYYSLNQAIEKVKESLSDLDRIKNHLSGQTLRKALKHENKLLTEQIKATKNLIREKKKDATEQQKNLKSKYNFKFDKDGYISNYENVMEKERRKMAKATKKYNNSDQDEQDKKAYENAEKRWKKVQDEAKKYGDIVKEIEDKYDENEEARLQKIANNLQNWELKIQLKMDKRQMHQQYRQIRKELQTDITKNYKDYGLEIKYNQKSMDDAKRNIATDMQHIEKVQGEIDKLMAGESSEIFATVDEAQAKLKEFYNELADDAEAAREAWESAWESYLSNIDQFADKYEQIQNRFEETNSVLEYQGQLINLIYGEEAYDKLNTLYEGQIEASKNNVEALKVQAEGWKELFEQTGASLDDYFNWDSDTQKYYDNWKAAEASLRDETINNLQLIKAQRQNTINATMDALEKSLLQGSTMEDVKAEWERITAYQDKYYDNAEKNYQIQTLSNKMLKESAKINNVSTQQRLKKVQEQELALLREKDKLTEYDIKRAELRYQLELKQMALEDARNNKTSMKLTRNEQGNWSYQYVADQDDVIDKRQEYLDTWNELYQLSDKAYRENMESMQDLTEKYLDQVRKLEEDYANQLISYEEYSNKRNTIDSNYFKDYNQLAKENDQYKRDLQGEYIGLLKTTYDQDQANLQTMTTAEQVIVKSMEDANINSHETFDAYVRNSFDELLAKKKAHYEEEARQAGMTESQINVYVADMMNKTNTALKTIQDNSLRAMYQTRDDWSSKTQEMANFWNRDDGRSVKNQVQNAHEAMSQATANYQRKVDELEQAAGEDFSSIEQHIRDTASETETLVDDVRDLARVANNTLPQQKEDVNELKKAWEKLAQQVLKTKQNFDDYVDKVQEVGDLETHHKIYYEYETIGEPPADADEDTSTTKKTNTGGGKTGGGKTSDEEALKAIAALGNNNTRDNSNRTLRQDGYSKQSEPNGVKGTAGLEKPEGGYVFIVKSEDFLKKANAYAKEQGYKSFNSGGYTGEWGDEGKFAVLHEKELVLNKQDTENFLEGINTIRDMTSLNGSISNAIMKALSNTALSLLGIKPGTVSGGTTTSNTDNVFNITAEFPNATNVDEIREAILSLPNIASQYTGRH